MKYYVQSVINRGIHKTKRDVSKYFNLKQKFVSIILTQISLLFYVIYLFLFI